MNAEEYLKEAIKAIGDRAKERDIEAERSAARAAKMFSALTGKELTELEAWQFMCCLKLVRSATGKFKADDFVDLAGYAALAGESAVNADDVEGLQIPFNYDKSVKPLMHLWYPCEEWVQENLSPNDKVMIEWKSLGINGPYRIQNVEGWGDSAVKFKIVEEANEA